MKLINRILLISAVLTSYLYVQNASAADPNVVKDRTKYPYLVAINHNKSLACTGIILDNVHVLTAAHCVNVSGKIDVKMLQVLVGGLSTNTTKDKEMKVFTVASANVHKNYTNVTSDNDVAVLKLTQQLVFTAKVKAISIWNKTVADANDCVAVGWGFYNDTNKNISNVLQAATVKVEKSNLCLSIFGKLWTKNKFCAAESQPICVRGAPVICRNVVRGLATITGPCLKNKIGLFTNVTIYSTWINGTLKSSSSFKHQL